MNILVVGLGSMGRRRIRLIKKYNHSYRIVGVDTIEERRKLSRYELNIETTDSLESALETNEFDCAVICTSPLSHGSLINMCLENGLHIFTELNLVTDFYDENIELSSRLGKVLFLSSTFLYRAEVKKINELVNNQKSKLNYVYHIGQYLPDWHPWENYKDFFVGNKRTNGCREIFAIELPWIIKVFGKIKSMKVIKDKISNLSINYNDNYLLVLEHESGHKGMLAVDVVSRKAVRNLELFGEDLYLSWDGSPKGFLIYDIESKEEKTIDLYDEIDQLQEYSGFVVENAYYDEIVSFFDSINNNTTPIYNFEQDKLILDIIDRIEAE